MKKDFLRGVFRPSCVGYNAECFKSLRCLGQQRAPINTYIVWDNNQCLAKKTNNTPYRSVTKNEDQIRGRCSLFLCTCIQPINCMFDISVSSHQLLRPGNSSFLGVINFLTTSSETSFLLS